MARRMFLPIMLCAPGVCAGILPPGRVWAQYEGKKPSAHSALRPLPVQQPQPVMWPGNRRMCGEKHSWPASSQSTHDKKPKQLLEMLKSLCVQGCQHNTAGEHCHVCAAGYYGKVRGSVSDCSLCACPLRGQRWGHVRSHVCLQQFWKSANQNEEK